MNSAFLVRAVTCAIFSLCALLSAATPGSPALRPIVNFNTVVSAYNDFGFDLFSQLRRSQTNANIVISPTSAAFALATACNGARGVTRAEVEKVLHLNSIKDWNSQNRSLLQDLLKTNQGINLEVANGIWVNAPVKPDFIARSQNFLGAEVFQIKSSIDPVAQINAWANTKTHGHISKVVENIDTKSLGVMILNATYFKGDWLTPFPKDATKPENFTLPTGIGIKHPRMRQSQDFMYYETSSFQAVGLPYGIEGMEEPARMVVFLPSKSSSLNHFAAQFKQHMNAWLAQSHRHEGTVAIPKFNLACSFDLERPLTAMGMKTAFQSTHANFRGIDDGRLSISRAVQKSTIEVNEKGTVATAVTLINATESLDPPQPFSMIVDRPFCFAIVHHTGAILFMGAIVDPR